jgi:hypothetical protein
MPEIMIPLVGSWSSRCCASAEETIAEVEETGFGLDIKIGTMIEIPRAALTADEIAEVADFFSFGTNDLTQLTFGYSRDDVNGFLPDYLAQEILPVDPFQSLDQTGVGQLVEMGVERAAKDQRTLKVGICGEHGGDPADRALLPQAPGLDYVSCSPFRVPIARLAAAQAAPRTRGDEPALLGCFLSEPDLVVLGLLEREHLLGLDQQTPIERVRPETDAADIEVMLIEPENGGSEFLAEVRGDEHYAGAYCEILLGVVSIGEVIDQFLTGIVNREVPAPSEGVGGGVERELGHHGRVPYRLEFHVRSGLVAFDFDNDEAPLPINAEQVDATAALIPVGELLVDDKEVGIDDLNLRPEQTLQVFPLPQVEVLVCRLADWVESVSGEFVKGHSEVYWIEMSRKTPARAGGSVDSVAVAMNPISSSS